MEEKEKVQRDVVKAVVVPQIMPYMRFLKRIGGNVDAESNPPEAEGNGVRGVSPVLLANICRKPPSIGALAKFIGGGTLPSNGGQLPSGDLIHPNDVVTILDLQNGQHNTQIVVCGMEGIPPFYLSLDDLVVL